jgi:hypothetical protein
MKIHFLGYKMNDKAKGFKYILVNGVLSMDQAVQVPVKKGKSIRKSF